MKIKEQRGITVISIILIIVIAIVLIILIKNVKRDNNNDQEVGTRPSSQEIAVFGINEPVTIKTFTGNYSVEITGIQEMAERNQFSDKNFEQVFLISYTYKNISNTESVYISDMDFQIIDEEGVIGDTYPNSISQYPQYITKGITCQAEMVLGVNNRSNVIQLQYRDNMFDDQPIAIFKLNV